MVAGREVVERSAVSCWILASTAICGSTAARDLYGSVLRESNAQPEHVAYTPQIAVAACDEGIEN